MKPPRDSRPCRVLVLSHGFQAEYEAGFVNGLAAHGLQVTLLASEGTLQERLDPDIDAPNVRGSQDPGRSRVAKAFNVLRYLLSYLARVAARRHDVVHNAGLFATGNLWLSLAEAAAMRLFARRFVLTVHNVTPHDHDGPLLRRLHRWLYALPHGLVVHTERTKQRLCREFGVPQARIAVMEHGIDRFPAMDAAARDAMRHRLGLAPADRLLLFFGNLGWYKGPDLLIDAMALLPPGQGWQLLIAGRCRHAHIREPIRARIDASPARAAIHWWERFVDDAEVPALFLAADLLAMPYRRIEQSGVLFMAMATGLPIVAADVGSFADYAGRHAVQIVPPEDVPALAAAIEASGAPASWAQRRALAAAAHAFDWRRTVQAVWPQYGLRADAPLPSRAGPRSEAP